MDSKAQIAITAVDQFSGVFKKLEGAASEGGSQLTQLKNIASGVAAAFVTGAFASGVKAAVGGIAALSDASEATGASVEKLSKIRNITQEFGGSFSDIESALPKLIKGLQGFDEETKGAGGALKFLGIAARESYGSLRDSGQRLL